MMNKILLSMVVGVWIILTCSAPWVLDDNNIILCKFMLEGGLISFLGILVPLSMGLIINIYFELNKIEARSNKQNFTQTRHSLRKTALWLILSLILSVILMIVKPLVMPGSAVSQAFFNGAGIILIISDILILLELIDTVFCITPPHK